MMQLDFADMFRNAPNPAMVLDRDYRFVVANAAYLKMVGKTEAELLQQRIFDVFPESPDRVAAIRAIFDRAFAGENSEFREIPFVIERDGVKTEYWWTAQHRPIRDPDGDIRHIAQYSSEVTDQVRLRDMEKAVIAELQHRVGNLFTVVGAIARQVARSASDVPAFMAAFDARVASFFKVQKQLIPGADSSDTLDRVIAHQLDVCTPEARKRISLDGPDLRLSGVEAQALSMAIHELATNSLKYGAVRNAQGAIDIRWSDAGADGVTLTWDEKGITTMPDTGQSGYGTLLLTTILPRQLRGKGQCSIAGDTLRYTLSFSRPPEAA